MKVAILAGGRGSRFAMTSSCPPKPLAPIGGMPVLWHVMELYRRQGLHDFVVALGHRGREVRAWFEDLARRDRGLTLLGSDVPAARATPGGWRVILADTGEDTANGSRLKRLQPWLGGGTFFLSWCDGLADLDFSAFLDSHRRFGRQATLAAVHPPSRFGRLELAGDAVRGFHEKPPLDRVWVNGGFFVLEAPVLDTLTPKGSSFERDALPALASADRLSAFRHEGFWACMDTQAEREALEVLWQTGRPPWLRERAAA